MDILNNKDIRNLSLEDIETMFKSARLSVNRTILPLVKQKLDVEMIKDLKFVLEGCKSELVNEAGITSEEERDVFINIRTFLRILDLNQKDESDILNFNLKSLSSYQVCELFMKLIEPTDFAQSVVWNNVIEDNLIDGAALAIGIPDNIFEDMNLDSTQEIKYKKTIQKFKNKNFLYYPNWIEKYAHDVGSMYKDIPHYFNRVKVFIKNPENREFIKGYSDMYRNEYITECNVGENTGTQTLGDTELALADDNNNNEDSDNNNNIEQNNIIKNRTKTVNLSRAIKYLFGDLLIVEDFEHEFNVDLAKTVNKIIGKGLFEAGNYRTTHSKPSRLDFHYLEPHLIPDHMDKLFRKIRGKEITFENWYEIAAYFFAKFLKIHPFKNGNGRTARLLLSVLLRNITIVPVSLYIQQNKKFREVYLNCLTDYQFYKNKLLLHSLIIQCVHVKLYNFIQALDVP